VVYHHLAGLPYADVGDLLGSSEAAARRSAADGIARLRKTAVRAVSPRNPREEQP
jgi:DNA-directed RNA polymerase specialized sigma24 family protein